MRASGNLPRASTIIASVKLTIDSRAVLENFEWQKHAKCRISITRNKLQTIFSCFTSPNALCGDCDMVRVRFTIEPHIVPLRIASHCPTSRCFSEPCSQQAKRLERLNFCWQSNRTMSDRFSCIRSQRMMIGERLEA